MAQESGGGSKAQPVFLRAGWRSAHLLALFWLALASPGLGVAATASESGLQIEPLGRSVEPEAPKAQSASPPKTSESSAAKSPDSAARPESKAPPAVSHQKGRPPKTPAATLPAEVSPPEADPERRRKVAEGTLDQDSRRGAPDTELLTLRDAERTLFPSRLSGLEVGFSFDLPSRSPAEEDGLDLLGRRSVSVKAPAIAKADAAWLRTLTLPDLPVRLDQRVVTYLKFYKDNPRGRGIATIWAKKAGRYVGAIRSELRRAGLPTDLVWLSMIESGHNPSISSPVGAAGLWQFMPDAGRMYGLVVDRWVDERRDPVRSTLAAIRFLSDLRQRFGNWELAMAAYNMGYAGLSRSIAKFNTNDYWTLSRLEGGIPWETTLYVPKIVALAIVMNNRSVFGLDSVKPDPEVRFETVTLEPNVPLAEVAQKVQISLEELRQLNPSLLGDKTPPAGVRGGGVQVRVPVSRGELLMSWASSKGSVKRSTVLARFGDTPRTLALEWGCRESDWIRDNRLVEGERIREGDILVVPVGAKLKEKAALPEAIIVTHQVKPDPTQELVFYEVNSGDELFDIAEAFGVSEQALAQINAMDERARLREGMWLSVLIDKGRDLSRVRHHRPEAVPILLSGSAEFHEYFEGRGGRSRIEVVVRPGDTLGSVGARYGMSVGSMERVNRRSRSTRLVPGESLIVYSETRVESAKVTSSPEPLPPLSGPAGMSPGTSTPPREENPVVIP